MPDIKVEGLKELQKALKANATLDDVKRVVRHNGVQMHQRMQAKADFKMGYQTGTTKQSIGFEIKDSGFAVEAGPTTEYSPYLEWGTRFMDAQPFVKPAYEEQKEKFESDLKKLMK